MLIYLLLPLLITAQTRSTFKTRDHSVKSVAINYNLEDEPEYVRGLPSEQAEQSLLKSVPEGPVYTKIHGNVLARLPKNQAGFKEAKEKYLPFRKPHYLKGEPGEAGPPGESGECNCDEKWSQIDQIVKQKVDDILKNAFVAASSTNKVFKTEDELLKAKNGVPEGMLAFALDSQRLFIRTNSGFALVRLDETILDPLPRPPPSVRPPRPCRPDAKSEDIWTGGLSFETCRNQQYGTNLNQNVDVVTNFHQNLNLAGSLNSNWAESQNLAKTATPAQNYPEHTQIDEEQARIFNLRPRAPLINDGLGSTIKLVPLNRPVSGLAGGMDKLDQQCVLQARANGVGGEFKALVYGRNRNPRTLVKSYQQTWPVVNIYGSRLFDSWDRVFGEVSLQAASLYTFDKRNILHNGAWSDGWLWHGISPPTSESETHNCLDWRSGDSAHFAWASPLSAHRPLFGHAQKAACSIKMVVLCVGT
ncbi:unnamed protein product [Bursaphelenchus okinawaensis]|uniref:Collagenase NC10/endostatin domain-containing protein n=1 Tax=Bursaphelenchus okinawaensis TaxID=465554 RepID=A0A811KLN7_9BILA|nr:unnamed protein product [Bursaphelenchus okinawaensis]CAG9107503.1 unnamed protein product [Bursaphelenchus okinawaensis]